MTDIVHVRNIHTGQVGTIRRRLFEHPYFNRGILIEVDADAKPYVPALYSSKLDIVPVKGEESDDTSLEGN